MHIKRTKVEPEKQDTTRRKTSLAGRTSSARTGSPPEENIQDVPAGPAGTHGGKNNLTNDSAMTHVVN